MGLGDLFKLAKLTIKAFTNAERQTPIRGKSVFEVQFNPETLSLQHESVFQGDQAVGPRVPDLNFAYRKPKQLSVNLVLDGTQVDHMGIELLLHQPSVAERIQDFLDVCYRVQGDSHEPSYLRLNWGEGVLEPGFDCRLQSVDVQYKSFDRDGSPLHAELAAVFVEHLNPPSEDADLQLSSPDLTHRRVVVDGDTLPLLCREIYGSAGYYLRVAQVNGLDDFRSLSPGQELYFPPFARPGKA